MDTKFREIQPKVSIGMPVFNGEKFIQKRIENVLEQSFANIELIISDNASTDKTPIICEEYSKKDKRISYIRQKKNMGIIWNLNFVLQKGKFDYFVWAAVDDIWKQDFLKKNMKILLDNKNCVCSFNKTEFYGSNDPKVDVIDNAFRNFMTKLKFSLRQLDNISLSGKYENKVRLCLKKSKMHPFYGVYRTDKLRKSFVSDTFFGVDHATILNILRHGDLHVIDEVLMLVYDAGLSKKGIIHSIDSVSGGLAEKIFPMYSLTHWCAKNLGIKLFLRNLDYFIQLNLWGGFMLSMDLLRIFLHKITGK